MTIIEDKLTESPLVHLFCRESEDKYQFSHYFDGHFGHRRIGPLNLCINRKATEKTLNAFKDVHDSVVAFSHRLGRLVFPECLVSQRGENGRIRTDSKTRIPEKIADAKGKPYRQRHQGGDLGEGPNLLGLARLTPPLRAELVESVYKPVTTG